MVCFANYCLRVPKKDLNNYITHVLKRIYSFGDEDLWFVLGQEPPSYKRITLIEETTEYYEIQFRWCTFVALRNVLPTTNVVSNKVYYTDAPVLEQVASRINDCVECSSNDMGFMYKSYPTVGKNLYPLVMQLASQKYIQKYFQLSDVMFLVVAEKVPIYLTVVENSLRADICYDIVFDVDDGFSSDAVSVDLAPLNECFSRWSELGDISAPIFPVNDL